jgi:hypothetical protein
MPHLVVAIIVGTTSGLVSTVATLFLAPRFQHYYWTKQRRSELILTKISELNAAFSHLIYAGVGEKAASVRLMAILTELGVIAMSKKNRQLFLDLIEATRQILEDQLIQQQSSQESLNKLTRCHHNLATTLYAEIGIVAPGENLPSS